MKILKQIILLFLLLPIATFAQEKKGSLMNVTEITVKPGHNAQFVAGVKLYKECYIKNKGSEHWNVWHRVQGDGNVYELTGTMANWAEMDKEDPASAACRQTVSEFILPHIESTSNNIAQNIPELSIQSKEGTKLIWVTFFKVKSSAEFKEFVSSMDAALKANGGKNRGYWYHMVGGAPESANYFITQPFKGFSDLDEDSDGIWKIYEKANGKKATDALKLKAKEAIDKNWSYIYTLSEDLSN